MSKRCRTHAIFGAPVLSFLFRFLIPCFGRVWASSKRKRADVYYIVYNKTVLRAPFLELQYSCFIP